MKPCPFCGSLNITVEWEPCEPMSEGDTNRRWFAECAKCSCQGPFCQKEPQVIPTWNGRIAPYSDDTESEVCNDIRMRQAKGVGKYGLTVANNPLNLRQWLQHAYEECLDQAVYLKRAMQEIDRSDKPDKSQKSD